MSWYSFTGCILLSLVALLPMFYLILRLAFRIKALECFRHEMQEGAVRRDAVAVQVGRVLGLRAMRTSLSKDRDRELRSAAYAAQKKEKNWAEMHEHAADVLLEILMRVQDELFAAGDRDHCESCKGESGGVPGNENIVNGRALCDYCSVKERTVKP